MRYRVLAVGRRADDPLVAAADGYLQRLTRYVPTDLVRVREGSRESERDALVRLFKPGETLVALDEHGRERTTTELATVLGRWQRDGERNVAFAVGGPDGLHEEIRARARETWSLSRFTLPHRLALVVLCEQLYRAHSLLRGEPYHRP